MATRTHSAPSLITLTASKIVLLQTHILKHYKQCYETRKSNHSHENLEQCGRWSENKWKASNVNFGFRKDARSRQRVDAYCGLWDREGTAASGNHGNAGFSRCGKTACILVDNIWHVNWIRVALTIRLPAASKWKIKVESAVHSYVLKRFRYVHAFPVEVDCRKFWKIYTSIYLLRSLFRQQ